MSSVGPISDLFAPTTATFGRINDPRTNSVGTVRVEQSGNPDLVPEIAKTYTAGLVYAPAWLPNFQLSVDWYKINIDNAIGTVSGTDASVIRQCEDSGGTSPLCNLVIRPTPTSFPSLLRVETRNLAATTTHGVDVEARYRMDLAKLSAGLPGSLDLRLFYTYQPLLQTQAIPGATLLNWAGAPGLSKTRVSGFFGYSVGGFKANTQLRWYSKQNRSSDPNLVFVDPPLPSTFYADLNVSQEIKFAGDRTAEFYLMVNNLFDRAPRIGSTTSRPTPGLVSNAVNGDDLVGRYFSAGVRIRY